MHNEYFSLRTEWPQVPNALSRALDARREAGGEIIDLTESNPTRCGFVYPESLVSALSDLRCLTYDPQARGLLSTREAVAAFYAGRAELDPRDIVLTASTSEAYSFLFRLICNPGDKVLIPAPSYPLFQFLLEINDAVFDVFPLRYHEEIWRIDFEALEGMLEGVKALVVVNPNNPTGNFIPEEDIVRLSELCRERKISIIADEVFGEYAWEGTGTSFIGNPGCLTFVMGGFSKSLALPQMKLGWILASGPQSLRNEALTRLETIADTFLSVNTPVQIAAPAWLAEAARIRGPILERIKTNRAKLAELLGPTGRRLYGAQGGWYSIFDLPSGVEEEAWAVERLERDGVYLHPGYFFDLEGAHALVSLLPPTQTFEEGVRRIVTGGF